MTDELPDDERRRREKREIVPEKNRIPVVRAKILIAEDHPLNQVFIQKLLKRMGFVDAVLVENGVEVLEALAQGTYDMILMDCHMPEKNGYDTTQDIREKETGSDSHIPIIAMTANAMAGDREQCISYGMDDYISKPVDSDELRELLSRWIIFAPSAKSDKPGTADQSAGKGYVVRQEKPPVDLSLLGQFSEGDKDVEREFVALFVRETDKNIALLKEQAETSGENEIWHGAAHKMKGGSGNMGAGKLAQLCEKAQHMGAVDAQERGALYQKIAAEYDRVKGFLKEEALL